ncbi:hypothetical protein DY000_02035134 [Brassica cretica]|uniref:Uncharacterized protein n=1 Tax=Brassica cretica TaxID=69181 RepID=A0ABQ7DVQ7_BRACR|nr:hypothetical protein DY000_02035134 [Brassica cretica]
MVSRRRFAQVYSSDDEEDFVAETRSQGQNSRRPDDGTPVKPYLSDVLKNNALKDRCLSIESFLFCLRGS